MRNAKKKTIAATQGLWHFRVIYESQLLNCFIFNSDAQRAHVAAEEEPPLLNTHEQASEVRFEQSDSIKFNQPHSCVFIIIYSIPNSPTYIVCTTYCISFFFNGQ